MNLSSGLKVETDTHAHTGTYNLPPESYCNPVDPNAFQQIQQMDPTNPLSPNFYSAMQNMLSPQQNYIPDPLSGNPEQLTLPMSLPMWQPLDPYPDSFYPQPQAMHTATPYPLPHPSEAKYNSVPTGHMIPAPLSPISPRVELPSVLNTGELNDDCPPMTLVVGSDNTVSPKYATVPPPIWPPNADQVPQKGRKRAPKPASFYVNRAPQILYDPVYKRTVAVAFACAQCHRSKKKCVGGGIGKRCLNCTKRGCECKPRKDKRAYHSRPKQPSSPLFRRRGYARNSILNGINKNRAGQSIRLPASILQRSLHRA